MAKKTSFRFVARRVWLLVALSGCGAEDPELWELAERHAAQQSLQQEHLARQNQTLLDERQQVTEAARDLVGKDAEARRELLQAQRELQSDLASERSHLDHEREDLEQERRQLADSRQRAPVIADAIRTVGTLLLCLTPLLLAGYALSRCDPGPNVGEELSQWLVEDLLADQPQILPRQSLAALEHQTEETPPNKIPPPDEAG